MKISTSERKKFRVRNKLKRVSSLDRFRLSIFRSIKKIFFKIAGLISLRFWKA